MYRNLELEDLVIGEEVEVWKKINEVRGLENFKDYYFVSNFGRVKSTKGNDRIMKQTDNRGYLSVGLQTLDGKGKMMRVHRLVAFAFVEGWSEERNTVDHIIPDTKNNMVSNLQWLSNVDNIRKGSSQWQ